MRKPFSKSLVLAMAFALALFVGIPKLMFAHPATPLVLQDDPKVENQDLNLEANEGALNALAGPDGAFHDGTNNNIVDIAVIEAERAADQVQDQVEDVPVLPPGR